ncbi:mitochondrial E3 ubiquitin protein ligase 1 isoform X2 [Anabrus simplex]
MLARGPSGFWTNHDRLVQEIYNYVPFVICSGNQSAEILDPLSADILDLHTVADKYEPTSTTIADHLWSFFMGIRQRGLQSTEDILKEGTLVTCIGEVTVGKAGNRITLQRPSNGSPYFITTSPVSSIIYRLQCDITRYKVLIGVSATIGIGVISVIAYRWWKKRSENLQKEERRQLREAAREARRLRFGDDELPENQQCVVCCDCSREIIVFPCGHFCMCEDCSDKITTNCPICRTVIESKSHAYF